MKLLVVDAPVMVGIEHRIERLIDHLGGNVLAADLNLKRANRFAELALGDLPGVVTVPLAESVERSVEVFDDNVSEACDESLKISRCVLLVQRRLSIPV